MAINLFGDPFGLQGGGGNLQGGNANLQGGYNPQQVYGPVPKVQSPQPVAVAPRPVAPSPVVAPRPIAVAPAPRPVAPVVQPVAINPAYAQYVQTRASKVNPGVLEYYNPQNGMGFSNQNDVFNYLRTMTGQSINNLSQLSAPQTNFGNAQSAGLPSPSLPSTPLDPNQSLAQSAGLSGLGFDDYQKIISGQSRLSQIEQDQIRQSLGIPTLEQQMFSPPAKSTTQLYNDAYKSAGLADLKAQIAAKMKEVNSIQQKYTDKAGDVNENPFLSEASRVGRQRILTEQQQADIGNRNNQINDLANLYNSGLNEVGGLVTRQVADYSASQQLAQNHLTYLQQQAEKQITSKQDEKTSTAYKYLPDYLKAKAQGQKPDTIELNDGSLVSYDKNTGTFVTVRGPNQKPADPLETAYKQLQIQKLQQEIAGGGNASELLSPTDAIALGVAYGTTKGQAASMSITPSKPATDAQNQAAGYALRVQQSTGILDSLESSIQGYNALGFAAQMKLPSSLQSGNIQSYNQAARNFINAVLRRESGAAISPSEFDSAYQQYLPRPGDVAQTLAQKKQNRQAVLQGLVNSSGSAYGNLNGNNLGGSVSDPLGLFGEKGGGAKIAAANQKYPDGTIGGQCGTFAHKLVDFPPVGNYLAQKQAVVNSSGVQSAQWRAEGAKLGDVVISNIGQYGHVSVVIGKQPDGKLIVKDSNYGLNEKIQTRTISQNDPKIYGVLRGTLKV